MGSFKKRWLIGIDIGGTKIAVSLGTSQGRIVERRVFSSRRGKDPRTSVEEIKTAIRALLKVRRLRPSHVLGIGVGVPGPVHPLRQAVERSPHLPGWRGFPLRTRLSRVFRVPVTIDNDANAAALGEQYFGGGRGISDFLYITVSTGIGSGIVTNGRLVRGEGGSAGEFGHTTIVPGGLLCSCKKKGCLEAYASGTAIAQFVKRALVNGKRSGYFKKLRLNEITGKMVSDAALLNDRIAIEARRKAADYLGIGLANVINLLNPKRIILGGGVMEAVHHFWEPMMKAVRREAWPIAFRDCRIVRSSLGGRSGELGAMSLVLDSLCPHRLR